MANWNIAIFVGFLMIATGLYTSTISYTDYYGNVQYPDVGVGIFGAILGIALMGFAIYQKREQSDEQSISDYEWRRRQNESKDLESRVSTIEKSLKPQADESKAQVVSPSSPLSYLNMTRCPHCGNPLTFLNRQNNHCDFCDNKLSPISPEVNHEQS